MLRQPDAVAVLSAHVTLRPYSFAYHPLSGNSHALALLQAELSKQLVTLRESLRESRQVLSHPFGHPRFAIPALTPHMLDPGPQRLQRAVEIPHFDLIPDGKNSARVRNEFHYIAHVLLFHARFSGVQ